MTGFSALLLAIVVWALPARPYEAPWAWISFIGMCIVEDFLLGAGRQATVGRLPLITLLAAVIVFRRHPELTVLVAGAAAPVGSLLKGQRWPAQLTVGAQWVLAVVVGAAAFRLVGFGDLAHWLAATAVLMGIFFALGPVLTAWLEAELAHRRFGLTFPIHARFAIPLEFAGVALALAWRTAWSQPSALKVADAALVALAGITAGVVLAPRARWLFRIQTAIPYRPALAAGFLLLLSQLASSPLAWLIPLVLAVAGGIWAGWRRVYPIACTALGAFSNEIVRAANGGHMPVEGYRRTLDGFGAASDTYVAAGPGTNLAWLDDRFQLPPPFPGIASIGDILIAIGLAWFVAALVARRRRSGLESAGEQRLDQSDATSAA